MVYCAGGKLLCMLEFMVERLLLATKHNAAMQHLIHHRLHWVCNTERGRVTTCSVGNEWSDIHVLCAQHATSAHAWGGRKVN